MRLRVMAVNKWALLTVYTLRVTEMGRLRYLFRRLASLAIPPLPI